MLTALLVVILALIALVIAPLTVFYGTRILRRFGYGKCGNVRKT